MTPYYADASLSVHIGDCRAVMAEMEPESVHCVVTSPPYWGLRDYGVAGQLGLEPTPEAYVAAMVDVFREVRRVLRDDGTVWLNLGDSYAANGSGQVPQTKAHKGSGFAGPNRNSRARNGLTGGTLTVDMSLGGVSAPGLKPKDLVGIPWRVAFALQADGWYLRSDIIWSKPNPMPESVTDRPTKSHEYLFLLSKSPRYYFDADAVREADSGQDAGNGFAGRQGGARQTAVDGGDGTVERWRASKKPDGWATHDGGHGSFHKDGREAGEPGLIRGGRNLRSVWTIATQPYPGAHFATFPEKLVEPCVKAGTSERGVCPECGAPWARVVERTPNPSKIYNVGGRLDGGAAKTGNPQTSIGLHRNGGNAEGPPPVTTGWRPICGHYPRTAEWPDIPARTPDESLWHYEERIAPILAQRADLLASWEPLRADRATILDPFAGSGTVGRVANRLGRRAVLIDLSADYIDQAMLRNAQAGLGLGA